MNTLTQVRLQVISYLVEQVNLRQLTIQRIEQKGQEMAEWKQFLSGEIAKLNQAVEILREDYGSLAKALVGLKSLPSALSLPIGQEPPKLKESSKVKIRRGFNTIIAQVFLYRGTSSKLPVKEIVHTALELGLLQPHLKGLFDVEPGRVTKRKGFRLLDRVVDPRTGKFLYFLTGDAKYQLRKRLGKQLAYRGDTVKIRSVESLF